MLERPLLCCLLNFVQELFGSFEIGRGIYTDSGAVADGHTHFKTILQPAQLLETFHYFERRSRHLYEHAAALPCR